METATASNPLSWVKRIPGELFALDEKPLFGSSPPFPWEELASLLSMAFQIDKIEFHQADWRWRSAEELFEGYGDHLKVIPLNLTPIEGSLWWAISELDFTRMMALALQQENLDTLDPDINEALLAFFTMQVVTAFGKCNFDKSLTLHISEKETKPTTACLTLDVNVAFRQTTFAVRLLLSPEFRNNWKQRYYKEDQKARLQSPLAESLEVTVHLEAGRVLIQPEEWKQLKQGDFIVLDSCSLDPEEVKGRVMLVINGSPYFRAKLKKGDLKILEYPLYYEVPSMNTPTNEPPKEGAAKEELDDDFDEIEEGHNAKPAVENKAPESADPPPSDPPKAENKAEDDLGDFDEPEIAEKPETAAAATPKKEAKPTAEKAAPPTPKTDMTAQTGLAPEKALSIEDVPLCVVLEVGRIQMSVKKLLELQPGNMLELDIHPETGVDMVVNGKKIARGELLKIGEAIGVRIAELS